MPYCNNEGVSIYYEVEGEGPPLVLEHGLSGSLELWRHAGYVKALKDDYQIILIDARGHGKSDKPHDPEAYRLDLMVADVVAVLDDLQLGKAHFLGFSMGGLIGWGIAKHTPERFHSLLIQDNPCMVSTPTPFLDSSRKGMDALLEMLRGMFGEAWTPELESIFQSNDLDALIALLEGKVFLPVVPDPDNWLPTVTLPCLIIAAGGTNNNYSPLREHAMSMPNATFAPMPNLNHIETNSRLDLVLPHITKFLAEVNQI